MGIAFLFSGQGVQQVGMGKDFYSHGLSGETRRIFQLGEEFFPGITDKCFCGSGEELTRTINAQPALFLTELGIFNELKVKGIKPDAVAGFSLGEITALAACNVLREEDAFRLVCLRAREMEHISQKTNGDMIAVLGGSREKVEEICSSVGDYYAVNFNCAGQITCSGKKEKTPEFLTSIKANGMRAVKLSVSGAFHSPFMRPVGEKLEEFLSGVKVKKPDFALYSNVTAKTYPEEKNEIIDLVKKQVFSCVMFEEILRNMYNSGIDTFIEIGAGKTLTNFVKKTLTEVKTRTVTNICEFENIVNNGI